MDNPSIEITYTDSILPRYTMDNPRLLKLQYIYTCIGKQNLKRKPDSLHANHFY